MKILSILGLRGTAILVAALVVASLFGCSDSTSSGPVVKPESELEFVPIRATAPALETTDTSFWAVKGEERELAIRFQGQGI